jgi:hypothetical protein
MNVIIFYLQKIEAAAAAAAAEKKGLKQKKILSLQLTPHQPTPSAFLHSFLQI